MAILRTRVGLWWLVTWLVLGTGRPWGVAAAEKVILQPEPGAWSVLGDDASAQATREDGWSRGGRSTLDYRYKVGKGNISVLVLPVANAALGSADGLRFQAKASHLTNLTVALEEQGGGRWTTPVALNAGQWQTVTLSLGDMVLATGKDDPVDADGRLDLARVNRVTVVDTGAMLASTSTDVMRFFGIEAGEHRVVLADLAFAAGAARAASADASVDGLDQSVPPWSVFGARSFEASGAAPLTRNGLVVDYRKQPGNLLCLVRAVPLAALASSEALDVSVASRMKTTLTLKLEQSDGDKFETEIELSGNSALQTVRVKLADFKRANDSASRNTRPKPEKASSLILLDIGGFFASKGDNRLWLQRVVAVGGTPALGTMANASSRAAAPAAVATESVDNPSWSRWTKRVEPVFSGPFSLIGDPSVIRDGALYRMFYNCYDPKRKGPSICQATSGDGYGWTDVPVAGPLPGRMIEGRPGKWDDTHETPFMLKFRGEYLLYFSGYRDRGGHFKSFPLQIGLAVSRDGVTFARAGEEPVLKVSPDGLDSDAAFSPTIVEHEGQLVMLYTAYCLNSCKRERGVYLMAATSTNGRDWVKREKPVLSKADLPQTKDGAAEAELVKGPDGLFYLFFTLLYGGDNGHEIGMARSASPFGPWEFAPKAIVRRIAGKFDDIGPIAPSVLIEGDKVRMWYHGFSKRNTIQIGYAEAPWPLRAR